MKLIMKNKVLEIKVLEHGDQDYSWFTCRMCGYKDVKEQAAEKQPIVVAHYNTPNSTQRDGVGLCVRHAGMLSAGLNAATVSTSVDLNSLEAK